MKRITKFLAVILAVMMLFSVAAPLSVAADSDGLNVTQLSSGRTPDPIRAIDAYLEQFFYYDGRRGGVLRNMPSNGFWTDAEVLEMFIDAYEQIGDPRYLEVAEQFYEGIIYRRTEDWSWNEYNDDVFWMTLATVRLYENTQNEEYLRVAKANFEMCYERAWDTTYLGGGFWWRTDNQSKNGCVNGPGALSALKLYQTTGEERYLNIGKEVMEWEFEYLFEEDTGKHLDNIDINGKINYWTNTGNQGNIIGPCTMLYMATGEQRYFDYAKAAADHAATLGDGEYELLNEGGNSGDTIGGKGLLARWLGYFIRECDVRDYDEWMMNNAKSAWGKRNSDDLMWGEFSKATPEDMRTTQEKMANTDILKSTYASWGCSAAVAWLIHTPTLIVKEEPDPDPVPDPDPAPVVTTAPPAANNQSEEPSDMNTTVVVIVVAAAAAVVAAGVVVAIIVIKKKRA